MEEPKFLVKYKRSLIFRGREKWWFQLIGGNGEPQATSESYTSKRSLAEGIEAFTRNAATAQKLGNIEWPSPKVFKSRRR